MRTHIYTAKEREAIKLWLSGGLTRGNSVLINSTLLRTNKNRAGIVADIHLFTATLKKLSTGPKRMTPDALTTHVFIAPMPIKAYDAGIYTEELRTLKEAERKANDESAPTSERLASAEDCIRIAKTMLTGGQPLTTTTTHLAQIQPFLLRSKQSRRRSCSHRRSSPSSKTTSERGKSTGN